MADTRAQHAAEMWIVDSALHGIFPGHQFGPKKLALSWGGTFAFDAVSEDEAIVVCISTSAAVTARGKQATAKIQKLKTDALYLLHLANPARLAMAFSEVSIRDHFEKCQKAGRFPSNIEVLHTPLPPELQERVLVARLAASRETSPVTHSVL